MKLFIRSILSSSTAIAFAMLAPFVVLRAQSTYTPYSFSTFAGISDSADDGNGSNNSNTGTTDAVGTLARFSGTRSVAVDSHGNVFVADFDNHTIRKITPDGSVTTYAGAAGVSGTDDTVSGPATLARFNNPIGLAVDSSDNVYVGDYGNHRIRKITPAGVVSTLAGSTLGFVDDNGAAAKFKAPHGIDVDAAGNVYVADTGNNAIRKITPAGDVSTLAGDLGGVSGSTDAPAGPGTDARFNAPFAVAVDGSGNVFVADTFNHTIRKVTSLGEVTTFAGAALVTGTLDDTGTAARFNNPSDVEFDSAGNLYIPDNGRLIRRITPAGIVTTLAGDASTQGAEDGTGINAHFFFPNGVAADALGNLYIADTANSTIRTQPAQTTPLSINSSSSGTYLTPYTATATGGDGTGSLVWALGAGSTASGAAINSSTGVVTFTSPGDVVFHVTKLADPDFHSATTSDFTLTVAKAAQAALSVNSSASGTFGSGYTATATGGSGTGALSWSLGTGSTAPGAAIDSSSGAVTSTGAGTVVIKVTKATDTNYLVATSSDFTVTLGKAAQAAVSVTSSASGTYGVGYTATASGGSGTGALVWTLGAGSTASGAAINSSSGVVTFTSPGTVVFNVYRAGDSDYLDSATTSDFTLTVAKAAQAALSVNSSASGTFGSGYTATATGGSGTGALSWSLGVGSTAPGAAIDSSSGAVTSTGAGTVVIKVTKATDTNYLVATSSDFTVTLGKAAQAAVSVTSSASGTYGVGYTATASGGSGTGALVWTLGAGSTASGAAINSSSGAVTFTSPGTVVFNVYRAGDSDYLDSATTSDFTLTVAKAAQATLSVNSSASGTFGSGYTATATGGSGTGALSWSLGAGSTAPGAAIDSSSGAVTSTGAGTVVIKVTKATDTNYLVATSADFTITLAQAAQGAVSVTSSASGTYGVGYTATASGGSGTGALVWTLGAGSTASGAAINSSSGVVTFTSPGTVVFNVYRAGDSDYLDSATTSDFTLTVAKAAQATLSVNSSASGTFGSGYTATATGGSGTGALSWSLGAGSTAPGAAINASSGAVTSTGAGTVVIKVTKATDTNYLVATSSDFTVTLAKAAQGTLSVSSSASGTFGSGYTATATGGSGTGALSWSLGAGSTAPGAAINASSGAVTSTGAGTVVIKVTKATDTNYLVATSSDFTVTLGKANAALTLNSLAATYDGASHAASATTTPASLMVNFTYNGSATAPTNAGTYAVVGTISDANYQGSSSGSLVISKGVPVVNWATPSTITYGTALSNIQLNASANVAGSFVYSPAAGTKLNAGVHTLNADFTPVDTANYSAASAQQTLIVNTESGSPIMVTQPVNQNVEVGSVATFVALASGVPNPTYQWRKNGVNIGGATGTSYTIPSVAAGDAGNYTVVATNSAGSITSDVAVLATYIVPPSNVIISITIE